MQIQVYSDNRIENSTKLVEWTNEVVSKKLQRFDEDLTRVTVHINDENGVKAGADDKRCQIEARARGLQPISVTHKSESVRLSVDGALDKLHAALTSQLGKLRSKRPVNTATPATADPDHQDALLEEDYDEQEFVDQADDK